jgi:hypothetical protein
MITNTQSGTNVHEIAAGIYRINTPVNLPGAGAFSYNQYLVLDDEPLLFHTGLRGQFPLVSEAIAALMPVDRLRYVGFSHFEADECGALNQFLAAAPRAIPVCGQVPHAWECGLMMDMTTRTFFCGDLFTQGGAGDAALTESDILGPSEAFRAPMDYFAHAPQTVGVLERLAREAPTTLAVMHGSAWRGDGAGLLRELGRSLQQN